MVVKCLNLIRVYNMCVNANFVIHARCLAIQIEICNKVIKRLL